MNLSSSQEESDIENGQVDAPLLSIITVSFNAARFIEQAIDSVANQTYDDVEFVVIDGGSSDGTLEIIRRNETKIDFWSSEPDGGIYDAMNKGVAVARGEWLYFLGADDYLWNENVLARLAPVLKATTRERVVYGQVTRLLENGEALDVEGRPWPQVRARFLSQMMIPHQGAFHHRSLFAREGFDTSFRIAGDYEFLLRHLRNHNALFIPEMVAAMRLSGISSDNRNRLRALRECLRARRKLGITRFPARLYWNLTKLIARLMIARVLGDHAGQNAANLYRVLRGHKPIK